MKIQYLIILMAVAFVLIIAGPVSAYSVSVSTINNDRDFTPPFQSYLNRMQPTRYQPSISMDIASGTNANGSGGSVSAFSRGTYEDPTTFVEFSNSVSVNGIIKGFSYSAKYDSSVFR